MHITFDPGSLPNARPWIEQSWWNVQRAVISAIKPAAFTLKGAMRKAIEKNRFRWPQLAHYTRSAASFEKPRKTSRRWAKGAKGAGAGRQGQYAGNNIGQVLATHPPGSGTRAIKSSQRGLMFLGQMKNVLRYLVMEDMLDPRAHIGILQKFTNAEAQQKFVKFQQGGTLSGLGTSSTSISKYWGALGMPLRVGKTMDQPKRELVKPLVEAMSGELKHMMEDRFFEKLELLFDWTATLYEPGKDVSRQAHLIRRRLAKIAAEGERPKSRIKG